LGKSEHIFKPDVFQSAGYFQVIIAAIQFNEDMQIIPDGIFNIIRGFPFVHALGMAPWLARTWNIPA